MDVPNHCERKREYIQIFVVLPAEFRTVETPQGLGTLAVHLNYKGLFIQYIKDLPIGTQVKLAILFPEDSDGPGTEATAEIISKEIHWEEDWEGYQYGIKFVEVDEKGRTKLKRLLRESFQREELSKSPSDTRSDCIV